MTMRWMKSRRNPAVIASLSLCAALPALPAASPGQQTAPVQTAPVETRPPEALSWHGDANAPDISGVWVRADVPAGSGSKEGWTPWAPPLKGAFADTWKKRVADAAAGTRTDDPIRSCLPPGMPRYMTGTNNELLIVQTPGRVIMYRDGDPVRRIWLDGRC